MHQNILNMFTYTAKSWQIQSKPVIMNHLDNTDKNPDEKVSTITEYEVCVAVTKWSFGIVDQL